MKTSIGLFIAAIIGFGCGYATGVGVTENNQSFSLELHREPQGIGISGRLPANAMQQQPATPAEWFPRTEPAARPALPRVRWGGTNGPAPGWTPPAADVEPCGVHGIDAQGNETYGAPCGSEGGAQ